MNKYLIITLLLIPGCSCSDVNSLMDLAREHPGMKYCSALDVAAVQNKSEYCVEYVKKEIKK